MIDWTQPVETTEDPPRPVRVLATDLDTSSWPVAVAIPCTDEGDMEVMCFSHDGTACADNIRFTLRNVAPPKPDPVRGKPESVLRIANIQLVEERDHWKAEFEAQERHAHHWKDHSEALKAKAEALQAEVDTLKKALFQMQEAAKSMVPVVDAVVAWFKDHPTGGNVSDDGLWNAVRAYQSKQAPAEPVLREAWIALYADGCASGFNKTKTGCENSTLKHERVECRRIAWMSDGSPVPSEASGEEAPLIGLSDAEFRRLCDNVEAPLIAERDHWKAKAEALQAEVERMKPVVDAAVAYEQAPGGSADVAYADLEKAVRAYQTQQAPATVGDVLDSIRNRYSASASSKPAEPVKNNRIPGPFSGWEPRHD